MPQEARGQSDVEAAQQPLISRQASAEVGHQFDGTVQIPAPAQCGGIAADTF